MSHTNDNAPIRRVVIACQGGASHTAFAAGALKQIFQDYSDQLSQSRPAADRYQIIGMSGTSGGSICAFLAWYGLITGGPQRASQLLEEFWGEDIAAKTFLEEVFLEKVGLQLLRMRTPPMGPILQVLTEWMNVPYSFNPQVLMDMWAAMHFGPLANFIAPRPEHVNMEDLFKKPDPQGQPLVDRNQVWYIGEAQRTLQRISKIISELNVLPDRAKNIDGRLREIQKLAQRVLEIIVKGQFQASIRDQLKDILEDIMGWQASDPDLTAGKKKFVQPLPTLLLGATDVLSGAFKAFDSRKGEVSIESVLASTTLPELWRARTIGNQIYWDGLYSENPPIRGFVELPDEPDEKPDEIWLIKIDPPEKLAEPEDNTAIADRRNELTGDLSFNQEVNAIENMNQWLGKLKAASRRKYKVINILRMQLDEAKVQGFAGGTLDVPSKMYRGRDFVRGLMTHGVDEARKFLPIARQKARLRRLIDRGWNGLMDGTLPDASAVAAFPANHVLEPFSDAIDRASGDSRFTGPAGVQQFITGLRADCLRDLTQAQGPVSAPANVVPSLYVTIDDLIVKAVTEPDCSEGFWAACRWTLRGTQPEPPRAQTDSGGGPAGPRPRSVKIQGTWVSHVVGDQFLESWVWDTRNLTPLARPTTVPPDPPSKLKCGRKAIEVVKHWLTDGWVAGNLTLIDECFATGYIHNDCGYFPEICGRDDYREWLGGCLPCPDLEVEQLFDEYDRVVALLRWSSDQMGVVIYRVAGGEIQESWWTWDTTQLLRIDKDRSQK